MMKTSKQVEPELEEAKARYKLLKERRVALEKELKEVNIELGTYESYGRYFWGKIKPIEKELEVIKLIEESEKLPKPVFKRRGDEYVPSEENYRVTLETPKRIYLKRINKEQPAISEDFLTLSALKRRFWINIICYGYPRNS